MNDQELPKKVVGLYSFPKSGNTWLRAIIAGATSMPMSAGALQKYVTDTHYGRIMQNPWSFQGTDWFFYKSHRKHLLEDDEGDPLHTDKVLYIYRHPLDVFVSYLNFVSNNVSPQAGKQLNISFDTVEDLTPEQMEHLFSIFLEHGTLMPRNKAFGGVFEHVANFRKLKETWGQVHILRYEDLFDDFEGQIAAMCGFLGLENVDLANVYKAADKRTQQNGKFFWKRQRENFRNYLTDDQVDRFVSRWGEDMSLLGYEMA
ncbi:sulfotransferase domain-containing protein [Salipiger sp.]|uniref:sulfotransferase domain-containing protein n=1 Tax=Salipiger sp. TaxID=2078585 RepID=UPI003A974F03